MPPKKKALCIRCPDLNAATSYNHKPDKYYATCRKRHQFSKDKSADNELWWPFANGPTPAAVDLSDPQTCYELLQYAEALDLGAKPPSMTDPASKYDTFTAKAQDKAASPEAMFEGVQITKGMLEDALRKVVSEDENGWVPKPTSHEGPAQALPPTEGADIINVVKDIESMNVAGPSNTREDDARDDAAPTSSLSDPTACTPDVQAAPVAVSDFTRYCKSRESHRDEWQGKAEMPKAKDIEGPSQASGRSTEDRLSQIKHFQTSAQIQKAARNAKNKLPQDFFAPRIAITADDENCRVRTNHFRLDISNRTALHEYRIHGLPKQASRPKRRMLILDMFEMSPELWSNRDKIASDYHDKIISSVKLLPGDADELTIAVPDFNRGL